ncbi:MAG: hypothetical protein R3B99_34225 [Polyangiales bacterium]
MRRDVMSKAMSKWVLIGVLAASATAFAGPLRGTVRLPAPTEPEPGSTPPYYWNVWNGFVDPADARVDASREVSVILVGGSVPEPIGCDVALSGGDFLPRTMVARPGQPLRIRNGDGCVHELQSSDLPELAPLGTTPGNTRSVTIPAGGPYHVSDRLYGHVQGVVHAVPDLAACGRVGRDGAFVFEGVPSGEYTLKVLRGETEVHSATVTVTDGETTLEPITAAPTAGN